ncbi:hypothetical protein LTR62_003096 [Meristemomyces frigidus]|uniref:Mid2 domain-containing protein n=1 Tax=Meristemomyces frigidus TaxID=1508187 RepID=A0AAN7TJV8_9PEZI|nr:hypothetical protein LTR62_003096 [Meristemomyces frigidus]
MLRFSAIPGLALISPVAVLGHKTCYWPNHDVATNYTACNAASEQSHCCRVSEICLTNGLCLQTKGLANRESRGACTDQTFSSPACPGACNDVVTSSSLTIFLAYDDVQNNGAFCCVLPFNSTSQQCQVATKGSTQPFDLDPFHVIVDRSSGATLPQDGSDFTAAAATTASASGSSTPSSATCSDTATATTTVNASIAPVAAGIAAPLGILLIAALIACGMLFSQVRKLRRQQSSSDSLIMDAAPIYDYKVVPKAGGSPDIRTSYNSSWAGHDASQAHQSAPVEVPAMPEVLEADGTPIENRQNGKYR